MEPLTTFTGLAALMDRVNVDTDAIIPKQFLKGVGRDGLGPSAFFDWRYLEADETRPNPEFELNLPRYRGATILVAGDNFGCGSSREHAPWALTDMGFRTVVSTSFADIFYNNSIKNGLLPAVVEPDDLARLMAEVREHAGLEISVNLPAQTLTTSTGLSIPFRIEAHAKHSLLNGLDDIGVTQQYRDKIEAFERKSKEAFPWLG
jgi:3-isopropylmalate/(R)-2-methylmalate dehydratase small subunit